MGRGPQMNMEILLFSSYTGNMDSSLPQDLTTFSVFLARNISESLL